MREREADKSGPAGPPALSPSAPAPAASPADAPATAQAKDQPPPSLPAGDPSPATRARRSLAALVAERSSALLYQGMIAVTFGGLLGTTIALILFGEKNLEILLGGVGGIAIVSGLLRWVVASIPDLDEHGLVRAAKRRVFILSVITTVAVFFGHRWAIQRDFPLIPLGADTQLYRRINKLEHALKQVEAQVGAVPMYRNLQASAPWARTWRRIPVRPEQPHTLRVEMTDTFHDGWVELVVTDEQGELLAARQGPSNRDVQLIIESPSQWSVNAGIRWWPRAMGPLDRDAGGVLEGGDAQPLQLQITAIETPIGWVTGGRTSAAEPLTRDRNGLFAVSGDSRSGAADELRTRCGGDGSKEQVYLLDLSDLEAGGWLRISAESELAMPVVLGLYAEAATPADADAIGADGGAAVWLREIACDASAVLFEDTRESVRQDILTSNLHVAVPAGRYYVSVDGLGVGGRRRDDGKVQRYTLQGVVSPFARPDPVEIRDRARDVHLVDLLDAKRRERCGARELVYTDVPVSAPQGGGTMTIAASLQPIGGGDPAGPYAPRLVWQDDPAATLCAGADQASTRVSAEFAAGERRTLRVFRPAPDRYPSVESLAFRVELPASEALREACASAPVLEPLQDGGYLTFTGYSNFVEAISGEQAYGEKPKSKPNNFALTTCTAGARWAQPEPAAAPSKPGSRERAALKYLKYHPGEDTGESIWRLDLGETTELSMIASASDQQSGQLLYASIIADCGGAPQVLLCKQAVSPEKARERIRLPAGTYHVIIDGEGSHALGLTPTVSPQSPLDPRSDRRAE